MLSYSKYTIYQYSKYSDTFTPCNTCDRFQQDHFTVPAEMPQKLPDEHQTMHSAASDLGLHFLLKAICPNT